MSNNRRNGFPKALIIGLVVVIIILGSALIVMAIGRSGTAVESTDVNVLETSNDECVACHKRTTPAIIQQYGHSTMASAEVICGDCHEVSSDYPGAVEHEGSYVLPSPTTVMCEKCHTSEVAQYNQSRHGLPAYVAFAGSKELPDEMLAKYEAIPEGGYSPDKERNALYTIEGPAITPFACEDCHNIGKPAADGSIGQCQKCHIRHEFSLEQARKPETCNHCHIGPDHPQWEIYQESYHGISYLAMGHNWEWEAEAGTLSVEDFSAPTCAICHMSGFGTTGTTHDVGDRLTWFLFSSISERRPSWQDNKIRMQGVCLECHNQNFIEEFYLGADAATERVNEWVEQSNQIIAPLKDRGLLTPEPFDEPIDFTYFNLWHHWGRTAKFGAWMQGPDYVQWHGAYEVLRDLADLNEMVNQKLEAANSGE